mgnify:FL=1
MKLIKHLLVFLVVWETVALAIGNADILPSTTLILGIFLSLLADQLFIDAVFDSVSFMFKSWFVILVVLAFITLFSILNKAFRYIFKSICVCFQPSPTFTWLPIFILIFGINETTMLITMVFGTIWLTGLNLINAIEISYDKWHKHCRNLNLNVFQSMYIVYFPSMKKMMLSMFKTSFNLSWRIMIAMEVIFGTIGKHFGIGTFMSDAKDLMDVNKMYAVFFTIIILGVIINWLIDIVAKEKSRESITV